MVSVALWQRKSECKSKSTVGEHGITSTLNGGFKMLQTVLYTILIYIYICIYICIFTPIMREVIQFEE